MITLEGRYFDGLQPVSVPAMMSFMGQEATITAGQVTGGFNILHLKVSPRAGSADRFITLPNGGQFACADHALLDSLPQESASEGPVAWLEERWGIALACVAVVFCFVLAAYFFGLPAAAKRIAAHIPVETEQALGRQALTWLDERKMFEPTGIEPGKQATIRDGFDRLRSELPLRNYYHLEFRSGAVFGPNALALPGGIIVITDDMTNAAETTEEVLAVLAHEIGHVELRHTMRSVLQNSAVAVVVAAVTADAASLSAAVAGLPMLLVQTRYSREFETEADEYAFRLLKQRGYSPAAFASLMERLLTKKRMDDSFIPPYISTHPATAERIERARNSALQ